MFVGLLNTNLKCLDHQYLRKEMNDVTGTDEIEKT